MGALQLLTLVAGLAIAGLAKGARLPPRECVVTLAAVFQLSSAVQLVSYATLGFFTPDLVALGVIACIPLLVASVTHLLWRTFLS